MQKGIVNRTNFVYLTYKNKLVKRLNRVDQFYSAIASIIRLAYTQKKLKVQIKFTLRLLQTCLSVA
jgi:hypothetical protein